MFTRKGGGGNEVLSVLGDERRNRNGNLRRAVARGWTRGHEPMALGSHWQASTRAGRPETGTASERLSYRPTRLRYAVRVRASWQSGRPALRGWLRTRSRPGSVADRQTRACVSPTLAPVLSQVQ